MNGNGKTWARVLWAASISLAMVLGAVAAAGPLKLPSAGTGGSPSPASASVDLTTSTANAAASAASPSSSVAPAVSPDSNGPHPGTIEAYEPVPGGATTEDPAAAYDTTSYEVILNVYQTLVSYNGSTTASFVPTLATCIPGQGDQCATDYGTGFTGIFNTTGKNFTGANGQPEYWTFVLDPAAQFYDPSTGKSWHVYPSDVMFSIARTLAWSTYPEATKTAGWILAQSLLPLGNAKWDGGIHSPYNNTPALALGSMLVNNSAYCPAKAMNGVNGNGCITFVADGSSQVWPEFLEFVEDNLGASIVPCGWFTYEGAGVPGWSGTAATKGDGSCRLPDGGNTTSNAAWTTYLASLSPTAWDSFIKLDANWPAPQPAIQWSMVGSGPYYASVTPGLSYALASNPAYVQPSGCGGDPTIVPGQYTGYCDPAPGHYIPKVDVTWETAKEGDSLGTDAIEAGTADFAGIYTTQTTTLLGYVHSGIWQYLNFATLSNAFTTINLGISYSAYNTTFAGSPLESNPLPPELFSSIGLRNFYVAAYPYTTIQDTINTVDGIQFSFEAGGPIPEDMGNYYPTNVSWPYLLGDPTQSAAVVGSAAWWWSELTTPSSPYYNKTLVDQCTTSSPCTWPIGYFDGAPADLTLIDDWASEVYDLSGHRLSPWPLALTFTQFLSDTLIGPYESPLASAVGFGWAPDYPDPTDYIAPIVAPNGDYTAPDTVNAQLLRPQFEDNSTCGHYGLSTLSGAYSNLTYWANAAKNASTTPITDACQGVAYNVASYWMTFAGGLPAGAQRVLDYNLITQITTALGLYVWNGQANELIGFAPWINPATVNENPVIGGGGDLVWFQVQYRTVYATTVNETGLPAGTKWSATFDGDTLRSTAGTALVFPGEPNGTYGYAVSFESGYSVSPSNGTLSIAGKNVYENVTYTAFPGGTVTRSVYFNQTGLVSNTTWQVVVMGYGALSSNGTDPVFALPEGKTYTYQAQSVLGYGTPTAGSVTITVLSVSKLISYRSTFGTVYDVNFTEAGLPSGATWAVAFGPPGAAYALRSNQSTQVFYELNGSLNYTITVITGWAATPEVGAVTVSGSSVTVLVIIAKTYAVTFSESGLASGTVWTVFFAGTNETGTAPASITFEATNASWTYSAAARGYTASPTGGSVIVSGQSQTVPLAFTKPSTSSPAWDYLSGLAYGLIGLFVVLTVVGFAVAGRSGRGRVAKAPETWSGEQPQTPPPSTGGGTPPTGPPTT